jgi:hypothetical protein
MGMLGLTLLISGCHGFHLRQPAATPSTSWNQQRQLDDLDWRTRNLEAIETRRHQCAITNGC